MLLKRHRLIHQLPDMFYLVINSRGEGIVHPRHGVNYYQYEAWSFYNDRKVMTYQFWLPVDLVDQPIEVISLDSILDNHFSVYPGSDIDSKLEKRYN